MAASIKLKEFGQDGTEGTDKIKEIMHVFDDYSNPVLEVTLRAIEILDANYSKTNINNIVKEYSYLSLKDKTE